MGMRHNLVIAAAAGAAVVLLAPTAGAAPVKSPLHPPTFEVICQGREVVILEATGAANFTVSSGINGADSVIVSAEGTFYDLSGNVVGGFQKSWGKRAGMSTTITCTRDNTDEQGRAVETFVIALIPSR